MDDLPPWVIMQTQNAVVRSVLEEMFGNGRFRADLDAVFRQGDKRPPFKAYIGDAESLAGINAARTDKVLMNANEGAAAMYDSPNVGGIFVDVDRLHEAVGQDSAQARELVRDAFLHEFAHLYPVAQSRDMSARTGDPKVGSRNQAKHPVMQGENRLRALFDLPAKSVYGLMGMMGR
jgi:hypothetical protein